MAFRLGSLACALIFCAPLIAFAEPPPILTAAEELLRQITPDRTSYKHKEPEVRWSADPANPAYCHTDCSGLIIALLERCYPEKFGDGAFKRWLDSRRPTARRFYDAIAAERGFARIDQIANVAPGDVVAMKYPPGGENTGHMMLVAEPPRRAPAGTEPQVEGTEQWLVPIIDETGSAHGAADSRRQPDGTVRAGLGRGVFRLYARPDGTIVGYTWGDSPKSKYYGDDERVLAIGRFQSAFQP